MDAPQFLAEFGHIANAPGGVARLRELILALAVQGKLVAQDIAEEPAEQQILRITAKALFAPAQGRRKKANSSAQTRSDNLIESLPIGWATVRLCDLLRVLNGRAYSKTELLDSGTPVLRVGNLFTSNHWYYSDLELEVDKYCDNDDLLYAWSASFGPFIWHGGRAIYHYHIWKLDLFDQKEINKRFLYTWLLEKTQEIKAAGHGIAMVHMTKEKFEQLRLDLPPIEEQARIVAKVDELMALCDTLEAQQQERRKIQNALRQSTLQAVASATSPHELQTSWARLEDNFGRLFSAPEDIKELRTLILQLGIRGLLVEQFETNRKNVEDFVFAVQMKREQLVSDGKIRRTTPLPAVEENEEPFVLPRGWKFCRLGQISICRDGQRIPLSKAEREPRRGPFPYYGASGIIDYIDKFIFEEDLLLVGEDGANLINRSTPIAFTATGRYWVNNHAHVLDAINITSLHYLELFINAIDLKPYVTGTAQPKMNQEKMNLIVVAVPPPDEQHQIVTRVHELIHTCDALESQLRNTRKLTKQLAISSVASLTGIAIEQEKDEPLKAPQTELIAPLRSGAIPAAKDPAPLATLLIRNNGEMSARDLWQRFGGEIDAFYAQLKTEVTQGWIQEPTAAEMREKTAEAAAG